MSNLDVSKMDFFKVQVEEKLVDMEEASPETEGLQDVTVGDSIPEAQEDNHHEV